MPMRLAVLMVAGWIAGAATAEAADLAFRPAGDGYFAFDTSAVRGKIRLDGRSQGITELIDVKSGTPIAHGGGLPGVFSHYRVFSTGTRYGHAARDWPTVAKVLDGGALQVRYRPDPQQPLEMTGIYRWTKPDTLDLETIVTPKQDMPQFEVFLSSYFAGKTQALVYVARSRFGSDTPRLLAADVNPLVDGTYLMFPRDLVAARMIFDGRWEHPPNPVQWSVTRLLAGPMAVRRLGESGLAAVVMSPPKDCFAVSTPYNKTPPDGVAGHASIYLSLFGRDLKAGETARAHARLVILREYSEDRAIGAYEAYCKERE